MARRQHECRVGRKRAGDFKATSFRRRTGPLLQICQLLDVEFPREVHRAWLPACRGSVVDLEHCPVLSATLSPLKIDVPAQITTTQAARLYIGMAVTSLPSMAIDRRRRAPVREQ